MKNQKRSRVPSGTPGRAAGRRVPAVRAAGKRSQTRTGRSAETSAPDSGTGKGTHAQNGNAPDVPPTNGNTRQRKAGRGDIDWRYLTSTEDWNTVLIALRYYQSTFVDRPTRDALDDLHDRLKTQEPTI